MNLSSSAQDPLNESSIKRVCFIRKFSQQCNKTSYCCISIGNNLYRLPAAGRYTYLIPLISSPTTEKRLKTC